jgi:hypothetical protein
MTKAGDLPIAESYGSRTPARVNGGICDLLRHCAFCEQSS